MINNSYKFLIFQDQNDNAPVFLTVPKPITLSDDVAVGTRITTLVASDADGTAPGNKVNQKNIFEVVCYVYLLFLFDLINKNKTHKTSSINIICYNSFVIKPSQIQRSLKRLNVQNMIAFT